MADETKKFTAGAVWAKDNLRYVVLALADGDSSVVFGRVTSKDGAKNLEIFTSKLNEFDTKYNYVGWFETTFIRFYPDKGDISFFGKPGLGLNESLFGLTNLTTTVLK